MRAYLISVGSVIAMLLCGCKEPQPQSFVDAKTLPEGFVGYGARAFATGQVLTVEVAQMPGLNVVGIDASTRDGTLYLCPRRISSGGGGTNEFTVDVGNYALETNWNQRVYWLVETYAYPASSPGFWSKDKRLPWVRKQLEVLAK